MTLSPLTWKKILYGNRSHQDATEIFVEYTITFRVQLQPGKCFRDGSEELIPQPLALLVVPGSRPVQIGFGGLAYPYLPAHSWRLARNF